MIRASSDVRSAAADGVPAAYGRACTNCAKAKCKCIYRSGSGDTSTCERCHRLGKACVPSVTVRKRTPRRPAASRTAQLEEKLDDLVSLLKTQQNPPAGAAGVSLAVHSPPGTTDTTSPTTTSPDAGSQDRQAAGSAAAPAAASSRPELDFPQDFGNADYATEVCHAAADHIRSSKTAIPSPPADHQHQQQRPPPVAPPNTKEPFHAVRGTWTATPSPGSGTGVVGPTAPGLFGFIPVPMSAAEAEELLGIFRTRFLHFFPFYRLEPEMTAARLQQERPLLMLTILTMLCRSNSWQISLNTKLRQMLAEKTVVEHEASIDILLSFVMYIGWGQLLKRAKPFLTLYTRLAITQVMDLGLHRPFDELSPMLRLRDADMHPPQCPPPRRQLTNEERRAALGCWWMTSMAATTVKRSDPLRWTAHLEEMLNHLQQHPEWPGDTILVTQVKTQLLCERLVLARWQPGDFPSAATPDPSRGLPAYFVNGLREQLRQIRAETPPDLRAHDAVEPVFLNAELLLAESLLDKRWKVAGGGQELETLHAVVEAVCAHLDRILGMGAVMYHGMSFCFYGQVSHSLLTLFRVSALDDPLWDRRAVRRRLDLFYVADRMIENFLLIPSLTGLEGFGDGMRRGGGGGGGRQQQQMQPVDVRDMDSFPNIYVKAYAIMTSLRAGWEKEIRKLDGEEDAQQQQQQQQQQPQHAASGSAGVGIGDGGAAGGMDELARGLSVPDPMPGVMGPHELDALAMHQHQQQQVGLGGQFDPLTGVFLTAGGDDSWIGEIFSGWSSYSGLTF